MVTNLVFFIGYFMQKLFLLRSSQLTKSNMIKSIEKFKQTIQTTNPDQLINQLMNVVRTQGGLSLDQYTPTELEKIKQTGIIYLFKIGQINKEYFIEKMNEAINVSLDSDSFTACWNAMCIIDQDTIKFLQQIEQLQKQYNFSIHVVGNTNSMHAECVAEQLQNSNINIHMSQTLSFNFGCFDPKPLPEQTNGFDVIDLRDEKDILTKMLENCRVNTSSPRP